MTKENVRRRDKEAKNVNIKTPEFFNKKQKPSSSQNNWRNMNFQGIHIFNINKSYDKEYEKKKQLKTSEIVQKFSYIVLKVKTKEKNKPCIRLFTSFRAHCPKIRFSAVFAARWKYNNAIDLGLCHSCRSSLSFFLNHRTIFHRSFRQLWKQQTERERNVERKK